jgi:hypothetical protein
VLQEVGRGRATEPVHTDSLSYTERLALLRLADSSQANDTEGTSLLPERQQCTIDVAATSPALASLLLNTVVGMRLLVRVSTGPERLDRVIDAAVDAL